MRLTDLIQPTFGSFRLSTLSIDLPAPISRVFSMSLIRRLQPLGRLLIAVASLALSILDAQTGPSAVSSADSVRQRIERSIGKQRIAVASMSDSISAQQRSVARQPRSRDADFAEFHSRVQSLPQEAGAACGPLPSDDVTALVDTAAASTSVSAELIRSVMRQESAFRPCAVSTKGAMGLMQLIPGTAAQMGVRDAFDPEQNVLGGAKLLKQLLNRYSGDLSMTLSAYNAGIRPVDAAAGVPMIPETIDYVSRILARLSASGEKVPSLGAQSARDTAPDTSLRITGSDGGK
jgi:soluble lytic murein transglycosylase-like protein